MSSSVNTQKIKWFSPNAKKVYFGINKLLCLPHDVVKNMSLFHGDKVFIGYDYSGMDIHLFVVKKKGDLTRKEIDMVFNVRKIGSKSMCISIHNIIKSNAILSSAIIAQSYYGFEEYEDETVKGIDIIIRKQQE